MSTTSDASGRPGRFRRLDVPSFVLSAVLLLMGVTVVIDAAGVEAPPGGGVVGPAAFPWAIGSGLLVLGVVLGLVALRGRPDEDVAHVPVSPEELAPAPAPVDPGETAGQRVAADAPEAREPVPWMRARPAVRVLALVAGLLVHAAIIRTAGYVVAAVVLFVAVAVAFGAPRLLRTLLIGTVLALVIFYSFTVGLGLGLPDLGGG
jgi:putative tricarboxylic transport membrane protein